MQDNRPLSQAAVDSGESASQVYDRWIGRAFPSKIDSKSAGHREQKSLESEKFAPVSSIHTTVSSIHAKYNGRSVFAKDLIDDISNLLHECIRNL